MDLQPLDIVSARVRIGVCDDLRPCVVLYPPSNGKVIIAYISSQPDLCSDNKHFRIEKEDANFAQTGLSRTSYVSENQKCIELSRIRKRLGRMEPPLSERFIDWYGL